MRDLSIFCFPLPSSLTLGDSVVTQGNRHRGKVAVKLLFLSDGSISKSLDRTGEVPTASQGLVGFFLFCFVFLPFFSFFFSLGTA